jgi:uncharacterized protein
MDYSLFLLHNKISNKYCPNSNNYNYKCSNNCLIHCLRIFALDIKMETQYIGETKEEVVFFPFLPAIIRATSGRVSGILVKNERNKPSMQGTLVYLNANPSIREVIDRIEPAGGKIIVPYTKIMAGCIAVIIDTEGNRVGLHAAE